MRVIPRGTVDNNQGPDRLAGPKALDPNYLLHTIRMCADNLKTVKTNFISANPY